MYDDSQQDSDILEDSDFEKPYFKSKKFSKNIKQTPEAQF